MEHFDPLGIAAATAVVLTLAGTSVLLLRLRPMSRAIGYATLHIVLAGAGAGVFLFGGVFLSILLWGLGPDSKTPEPWASYLVPAAVLLGNVLGIATGLLAANRSGRRCFRMDRHAIADYGEEPGDLPSLRDR